MAQTFANITDLRAYVNLFIKQNGANQITGDEDNTAMNGMIDYIINSVVNNKFVQIISGGGAVVVSAPMSLINGSTPATISWNDTFTNEYYIVNGLGVDIPLLSGKSYIDAYGTAQTIIPARTVIHIAKATNGSWIQVNNTGNGGSSGLPPEIGHAGQFLTTNGTTANWDDPHISLTSADFEPDGVTYLNPRMNVTNKVSIFWTDIPNFIYESNGDWQYVFGGIKILLPQFNAHTNPNLKLELFFKGLTTPVIPPGSATTNSGNSVQSGDGIVSVFSIPHGLVADPSYVNVTMGSGDALASSFYLTHDATNIYINYSIAPPPGSNNLTFYWSANL